MKRQCVSRARARVSTHAPGSTWPAASWVALVVLASTLTLVVEAGAQLLPITPRSTTIALTSNDQRLVVVNRETNSVSVIQVRDADGNDIARKLAEIAVGLEPRCVALHPNNQTAFVTNTVSGTVSVISLTSFRVLRDIPVGAEPRGCALTPNGARLYVANHTQGTLSAINPTTQSVVNTIPLGGNPTAIAITNDGDDQDTDERVFITDFYARPRPGQRSEANDVGKQGVVWSFPVNNPTNITQITLLPLDNSGFTANRSQFCPQSFVPPAPGQTLHSNIFCPNVNAPAGSAVITQDPQGVFPNQLLSALIRGNSLYLPNIGAQPEPPFRFNTNVQALVHLVNTQTLAENHDRLTNLNIQVATEAFPDPANPATRLRHLFGNDLVAIDATNLAVPTFLIVSRGGNFVFRAVVNNDGILVIQRRYQTGNLPNGVVISRRGPLSQRRAYVNNEANVSVTAIHLGTNQILEQDIPSGTPPAPGTFAHAVLMGKVAFHTALGVPDDGLFEIPIRELVPLRFRGKASDNAWSGCASCHPDGLSDRVTWIFDTGPRQTIPLDATFAKDSPADQRILNWNAVRGSNTDFNQNSRGVQGGCGFASAALAGEDPPNPCTNDNALTPVDPAVFNHGRSQGVSDALDVQTLWIQTVRPPILPLRGTAAQRNAGAALFENRCASCHGGAKWSKSQVVYADNPAFTADPAAGGVPRDPGVTNAAAQIVSYEVGGGTLQFLDPIGTFNANNQLEIRNNGITALGGIGFNAPALLGLRYHAPFFHDGSARTLGQVFARHALGAPPGTIATALNATQELNLVRFLESLDGSVPPFESATDDFLDGIID